MRLYGRSNSQAGQESFVLGVLQGLKKGTFVEIGSADPITSSNTLMLEQEFEWLGIGIDIDADLVLRYNKERQSVAICADATKIDFKELFRTHKIVNPINYLQVDVEPSTQALECLYRIPFEEYEIQIITFEHDSYIGTSGAAVRNQSRNYLQELGFALVYGDVKDPAKGRTFEDWYVRKTLLKKRKLLYFRTLFLILNLKVIVKLRLLRKKLFSSKTTS